MLHFKKSIYLGIAILLTSGCSDSQIVEEPTSTLEPDKTEEIIEQRKLAKKMFTSVLTRLADGMINALIIQSDNDKDKLQLAINHSDQTLHELCRVQETCVGGIYSSVHNNQGKGEILHRVYKGQTMQIACAWLESYPSEFGQVDEQLQQDVIGRSWHWVKVCFED